MNIRILGANVVAVNQNNMGTKYDARAVADMIATVWAEYQAKGWIRQGPNFAQDPANSSNVVNLNQEAMKRLDAMAVVPKTEVIVQTDAGTRDRYLLTPDEVAHTAQTGVLPTTANVSAAFNNALAWTVKASPAADTAPAAKTPWALVAAAVGAYFLLK